MDLENWMADYQDRPLGEMHLPGSHDAGTSKEWVEYTGAGTQSNAATQTLTIPEQLAAGTRFFDLRLAVKNEAVVAHHTTKIITPHGAFSSATVDEVLLEAARFCAAHRTEVVIFRISHTSAKTRAHEIVQSSGRGSLHTGTGNLCKKTLGQIVAQGGGLICILDQKKFAGEIDQAKGVHAFTKFNDGGPSTQGIACCGVYEGTHKLETVVRNGLKGQYTHNEKHNPGQHDHLWQVYWQKTYTNPFSSTGIERGTTKKSHFDKSGKIHGGTHATTDYMIHLMKGHGPAKVGSDIKVESSIKPWKKTVLYSTLPVRNYTLPNIFSYDFVNGETNKKIIAMNQKDVLPVEDDARDEEALLVPII